MPLSAAQKKSVSRCLLALLPAFARALPLHANDASTQPDVPPGTPEFWARLALCIALVLLGGIFAGLTLGLMGLDMVNLQVLSVSGTEEEQTQAAKVLKLLQKGRHWVLVVLLLSNVIVNESLPVFLDDIIGGGFAAILLSTTMIVIFGEIIPQSVSVRYGLAIGSKSAPFVLVLMWFLYPIAYPIAKLLDWALGEDEGTTYKKAELKTFVGLHRHLGDDNLFVEILVPSSRAISFLNRFSRAEDEVTIISAVLELSEKSIKDIMTPIEDVFTLSSDQTLDTATVEKISQQGYSRVPVWEKTPENFIGMLLIKKLISYDPDDNKPVREFALSVLPEASPTMSCLQALNFFQEGRSHILLVSESPGETKGGIGVVTLEDVIEEIIGEEIVDETDVFVDVARHLRVVRRPNATRRGPSKALVPILKDALDKRKVSRDDYGTINEHAHNPSVDHAVTSRHVKVKGGGTPLRKPSLVVKRGDETPEILSTSPARTDDGYEHEPLLKKIHRESLLSSKSGS